MTRPTWYIMQAKKLLLGSVITLLVLLAGAGHAVYWYLPRARPEVPSRDSRIGRLLISEAFPAAVWMPFPHQNLGYLRDRAGAGGESLRAVARLAGLPSPDLPSFGPLAVPPASAMAIASDASGERWAIFAEVYPAFAAFARLAGRLADNPWLRGGEIYVDGRRAEVRWQGDLWTVASPALPALDGSASDEPGAGPPDRPAPVEPAARTPSLAVIQVRQAAHPLPSGRFLLIERAGGFEIVSASAAGEGPGSEARGSEVPGLDALGLPDLDVFLFAYTGRDPALGESAEALVGFLSPAGAGVELPRVATFWQGGERRSLPGESLLELAGLQPREGASGGWSIAALDGAALENGLLLAPRLAALETPSGGGVAWVLWFDLERGLGELSRFVEQLAQVPIVPRRQLERWRDVDAALNPLAARYSRLSVVVTREPRALRLRLAPAPVAGHRG